MLRWAIKARLLLFPADKGCSKQDWHNPTGWGEQTNDASTSPPPCNLPHPPYAPRWSVYHGEEWTDMILSSLTPPHPCPNKCTHLVFTTGMTEWTWYFPPYLSSLLLPTNPHTLVKTDTAICRTAIRPCGDIKSQSGGMNSLWASPSPWPSTSMSWMGRWLVGEVTCIRKQWHSQTYITNAQRHKPAMTV